MKVKSRPTPKDLENKDDVELMNQYHSLAKAVDKHIKRDLIPKGLGKGAFLEDVKRKMEKTGMQGNTFDKGYTKVDRETLLERYEILYSFIKSESYTLKGAKTEDLIAKRLIEKNKEPTEQMVKSGKKYKETKFKGIETAKAYMRIMSKYNEFFYNNKLQYEALKSVTNAAQMKKVENIFSEGYKSNGRIYFQTEEDRQYIINLLGDSPNDFEQVFGVIDRSTSDTKVSETLY